MLKYLDLYPKTYEEFNQKTFLGGTISLISLLVISILFLSEFLFYLQVERRDELFVDVSDQKKIEIYINITMPSINCAVLNIDVLDVSGEAQIGVEHTIYKRRLDLVTGNPLEDYQLHAKQPGDDNSSPDNMASSKSKEEMEKIEKKMKDPKYCGSCYGSELRPGECCNTCQQVKDSYQRKHWQFSLNDDIEQCVLEQEERKAKYSKREGCNVHGYLLVNKVAGNFHFAPGRSVQQAQGAHIHDYSPFEIEHFNTSHIIHSLGFGEKYPGLHNPLDGVSKILPKGSGLFQYFIKVVPTIYEYVETKQILTNQYSVTQHFRPHNEIHKTVVPGIYFIYDLSPIMVHITEKKRSFLHFVTNLCAVIGGVFTVAGIVDRILFHVIKSKPIE